MGSIACDMPYCKKKRRACGRPMETHSQTAQAAYLDLVRSLSQERVGTLRGSAVQRRRGCRTYWYDTYRVGESVRTRYLGEDSEELQTQISGWRAIAEDRNQRRRNRARLVRLLRAEGMRSCDRETGALFSAMAEAGVFRLGGTVVGTQAFRLYEAELGVAMTSDAIAVTDDIDIASFERLSLALQDTVETPLGQLFSELQFEPVPSLERGKVWKWRQTKRETLIEFLTPSFSEDEGLRELPALGVTAQSLHHLNYLIAEPIKAALLYRSGVLVQIPRPERYAIHKLIIADRRRDGADAARARKDRAQAAFLVDVLAEDRPDDLVEALEDARDRGSKWRERMDRTLARLPETAARLAALPG